MEKGEGNDYSDNPHSVDGMSGASMTGAGLNEMLKQYLAYYKPFIDLQKSKLVSATGGNKNFSIERNEIK